MRTQLNAMRLSDAKQKKFLMVFLSAFLGWMIRRMLIDVESSSKAKDSHMAAHWTAATLNLMNRRRRRHRNAVTQHRICPRDFNYISVSLKVIIWRFWWAVKAKRAENEQHKELFQPCTDARHEVKVSYFQLCFFSVVAFSGKNSWASTSSSLSNFNPWFAWRC